MRVVYFGSGTFSVPSLRAVLSSGHETVGVFTQPARRAGRGGKLRPTPVALAAAEAGREAAEAPDINADDVVDRIRSLRADVICVVDFGQMIRRNVLAAAPHGAMNLHGSLLPELRGAAPINWALIRGYRRTGVTTFRIVQKMDAGPMYLQAATEIAPEETADGLKERLAEIGAKTVCRTLDLLETGQARPAEQDHDLATLAPRLTKSDGRLDFTAEAASICNRIRGVWPWPGGQAVVHRQAGRDVPAVIAAALVEPGPAAGEPGVLDEDLCISTGQGRLRVVRIRPAGKRLMEWRDFVNGYRLQPGDRCHVGVQV